MDRLTRAERRYARLLRLYPGAYRERFGPEMRQTFRDLYRERGSQPGRFWAGLLADAVRGAAAEHAALIRSGNMKLYFSNSADQRVLAWGVGLMAPAGLFFLAAVLGLLRQSRLPLLPASLPVLPILVALLPAIAIAINLLALAGQIGKRKERVFSRKFAVRYFWTLALVAVSAGWLVFLFGHDTLGCAVNYLPLLRWNDFQHCAATH